MLFLDCTLRDGGYYNDWDFSIELIESYLAAMKCSGVDVVEVGFRSLVSGGGFKGGCAYTTDDFLNDLCIPTDLIVGVMVNASELLADSNPLNVLGQLFPLTPDEGSPVRLVRIACHFHEFERSLVAVSWLKSKGYLVGFNIMQIADRDHGEIKALAKEASNYEIDVLYFADSMGGMTPGGIASIVKWLREEWGGPLGIHTHDNLGLAMSNTLRALDEGVTWVDSTVTGMGRGPGNAKTEELAIELSQRRQNVINLVPLLTLIRKYFRPLQEQYGWGTNPYYYLSGTYGIHPSYVQVMLNDSRYSEEDLLSVIEYLHIYGGKKFNLNILDAARNFYDGASSGDWCPIDYFKDRDVLILGSGLGVRNYRSAIVRYIKNKRPMVIALNLQSLISEDLIDYRVACHPVRMLADCEAYSSLCQPLITPYSLLPEGVKSTLDISKVCNFGVEVKEGVFGFFDSHCVTPSSLVAAYALSIASSGKARKIYMAGFDGYDSDDPRTKEMQALLDLYQSSEASLPISAITPTRYNLDVISVFAL